MLNFFRNTNWHKRYWAQRKIDWAKSYTATWNHPHRFLISKVLSTFNWISLIEIGCGSGANIINIVRNFPGRQLGGIDINPDAIKLAQETFQGGLFKVGSDDDIMLSDDATDVILSDACLIYVGRKDIKKYIREIKRVARRYVILCEFNSTSIWNRLALKINTGYSAYNWKKLLESEGFFDVMLYKIPKEVWPGTPWEEFGYIILAKIIKI